MIKFIAGFGFLLLCGSIATAGPSAYQSFLQRDSPKELHFLVQGGLQCMVGRSELEEVIRSEFLKQKIKPVEAMPNNDYLYANLECALHSAEPLVFAYRVGVRFIDSSASQPEAYYEEYSDLGVANNPDYAIKKFRESINAALLDYIEANLEKF